MLDKLLSLKCTLRKPFLVAMFAFLIRLYKQTVAKLQLQLTTLINIDNGNISTDRLNREELHLNSQGSDKLAINFIKKIESFKTL